MKERVAVIDNGTGYTKMGFAGNLSPAYDIPTLIADIPNKQLIQNSNRLTNQTLDFFIGQEAKSLYQSHRVVNPIEGGIVRNWDLMQKFWHRSIFDYLRCDPQQTVFILTEPPLNPPENREQMAEIFFETFNAKGLHVGVQAVLALISSSGLTDKLSLTGTVVDSGDGVTHVIPISDGFVMGSCIKHIPLAGSNISNFIGNMLRERNEKFPTEQSSKIIKTIKQRFGYVVQSGDLIKEFEMFDNRKNDSKLSKKFDKYVEGVHPITKQPYKVSVGYERFLGPEMFFHPQIIDPKYRQPLDQLIDKAIQFSPIDYRRGLYQNIVLSGGSTLFNGFIPRLQRCLQQRVQLRLNKSKMIGFEPKKINVVIQQNPYQRYAVWQGGSILATMPTFPKMYHTRQEYFERGSSVARYNAVFIAGM